VLDGILGRLLKKASSKAARSEGPEAYFFVYVEGSSD